ncbi:hypothetical protein GALL_470920 [mine drainage metagenome]|uniref:Uncharacterized protein n=1 Tax=mine drainage metagenome TaxID=410659 RepID=A0A1J5PUM2_9ZZZZ
MHYRCVLKAVYSIITIAPSSVTFLLPRSLAAEVGHAADSASVNDSTRSDPHSPRPLTTPHVNPRFPLLFTLAAVAALVLGDRGGLCTAGMGGCGATHGRAHALAVGGCRSDCRAGARAAYRPGSLCRVVAEQSLHRWLGSGCQHADRRGRYSRAVAGTVGIAPAPGWLAGVSGRR